jgi:hypothetical protein
MRRTSFVAGCLFLAIACGGDAAEPTSEATGGASGSAGRTTQQAGSGGASAPAAAGQAGAVQPTAGAGGRTPNEPNAGAGAAGASAGAAGQAPASDAAAIEPKHDAGAADVGAPPRKVGPTGFSRPIWDGEKIRAATVFWAHNGLSASQIVIQDVESHTPTHAWVLPESGSDFSGMGFGWGDAGTGAGGTDMTKAIDVGFWIKVDGPVGFMSFNIRAPHADETGGTSKIYPLNLDYADGNWHQVVVPIAAFAGFPLQKIIGYEFHFNGASSKTRIYIDDMGWD